MEKKSCNELDQQNYKLYNIKSFIVQRVLAVIHGIHHTHSCIMQQVSLKKHLTKNWWVFALLCYLTTTQEARITARIFEQCNKIQSGLVCFMSITFKYFYHGCKQQLSKSSWFLGNSRKQRRFKMQLMGKQPLPKANCIQEKWHFVHNTYTYRERDHTLQN